ncbi:MAG: DNA repair protein RecO [Actinomycetota bacterium]|nr:DNA repair protein RecO [Actinomycetota bacterium]
MTLYSEHVVVLRTWKLGEADRIVSMFGARSGKIRAVAKGVRKTKTKFGARLEPISYVNVQCWKGRELDIVTQAESIELFPGIKRDLERLRKGLAMVEVIEELAAEGGADFEIFRLLVRALKRLEEGDSPYLLSGYLWRLLQVEGMAPQLTECAECGKEGEGLQVFSAAAGGMVCAEHGGGVPISSEAVSVIGWMCEGELGRALSLPDSGLRHEVEGLAVSQIEGLLNRKVRALHLGAF